MSPRRTLAVALLLGLTVSPAWARTWSSSNGITIEADFVEARADGVVVLRRASGTLVEVKADRLSQADQEFVRQQAQKLPDLGMPADAAPAAEPADAPPKKSPCPEAAAISKSRAKLKETFADKVSRTSPTELATELHDLAKDSASNPTDRYVLLLEAANVASRCGNAPLIVEAIDELAASYEGIDAHEKKTELLENAAKAVLKDNNGLKNNADAVTTALLELADEVLAADNFAAGKRLMDAVIPIVRKSKNEELVKQVADRQKRLRDQRGEYLKVAESIEALKKEPAEPQANSVAGKYYALVKGDWKTALPLLAQGDDEKLKSAAALDQSQPSEPAKQVLVADTWWDLSEQSRGTAKSQLRARGAYWYERALPGLEDALLKLKAQARVTEAQQEAPEQTASRQGLGSSPDAKLLVGVWQMRLPGPETAKWEFKKDGVVTSTQGAATGKWRIENRRVMVRWDQDPQKQWASLVRPLNCAGIVGDSSSAPLGVRGRKIVEPNQPRVASRPRPQDLGMVIGSWQVKADDSYIATWNFFPSGIVTSNNNAPTGRWQLEERRLMIRWDRDPQKMWDSFERPLNPEGIVGDNWRGELVLSGQKLNQPAQK